MKAMEQTREYFVKLVDERRKSPREDLVSASDTDADGRIAPLATDLEPGVYRLLFRPSSPFFKGIGVEVQLDDGHYHIPLLVSSYGCTTYRGS